MIWNRKEVESNFYIQIAKLVLVDKLFDSSSYKNLLFDKQSVGSFSPSSKIKNCLNQSLSFSSSNAFF